LTRKSLPARATLYLTVALLVLVALRYTPELPDNPAGSVLQQGEAVSAATAALVDSSSPSAPEPRIETLNRGETLIGLFKRVGLSDQAAGDIVRAATAKALDARYLKAGMPVEFTADSAGDDPKELVFHLGVDRLLRMTKTANGWTGTEERLPWVTDTVAVAGTIHANLYQAMDSSAAKYFPDHAKDELAWALADIFEYRVDMSRDLQDGDRFRALVERQVGPGGITRVGKVLAADFTLSGSDVSAVLFDSKSASPQYYDASGKSLRAQFLRVPLEFRRISSSFGKRYHPILKRWKTHEGTDYAANAGTPVRAVGDAVVVRAGWAGGYGNLIELRHPNGYHTRYGHLRAFAKGIRVGAHVNISQTIGYVGTTGLSTGPHLHFEVIVNGQQRDSRVALKNISGTPIAASERAAFDARSAVLLASLNGTSGVVRLAAR
jgi:murein DD-endopeptidase MepM/ murein hydrolase activator NlpD